MKQCFLFVFLFFSLSGAHASGTPQSSGFQTNEVDSVFMINGQLSQSKVQKYIDYIQLRRSEIYHALVSYDIKFKGKSEKKSEKKADGKKEIFLFDHMLKILRKLPFGNIDEARKQCIRVLEIDYALKVEGGEIPVVKGYNMVRNLLKSHIIKRTQLIDGEAKNLVSPKSNKVFSSDELIEQTDSGADLSLLNPPTNSTFWKNIDIANVDVKKRYYGDNHFYKNIFTKLPKKSGKFKKVRKTQSKPKIDFTTKFDGEKRKFKLKLGAEMHSEITAAALASTLGFHVDISKYVRDFKLELPKDKSVRKVKKEWNSYFDDYDFDKYVKETGKDSDGKKYIIFHEALIETKPEELTRIGPWAWGEHEHRDLRETRGLFLFNVWISNNDLKEAGNNKIVMKDDPINGNEYYHYQHDLGFSFGRFFREKPQDFLWDVMKNKGPEEIELYFNSFQTNSGFKHVTYSDARWMVRLIAKLSRQQIVESVELGGWPKEVGMLLVEKLISRRNQLVHGFDLSHEFDSLEFDRFISTKNKVLVNGELKKKEFKESTQSYKDESDELLDPVYDGLESIAVKAALMATSHFDTIVLDGESLGYDGSFIGEIEISADREIVINPDQKGRDDNYLVEDTVKVRLGLGAGIVLRGKVNYIKEYKIVYPVKTIEEGRYKNGFIFNAMLPKDIRNVDLPEEYVLILEDSLEGEGEIKLGRESFPFSLSLSKSYGILSRTVISKKQDSFEVYRDQSPYKGFHKKLFAELIFFRIPIWHSPGYEGVLNRTIYTLDIESKNSKSLTALDELLSTGNMKSIVELGVKRELVSNYVSKRNDSRIFGLFESNQRRRTDDVQDIVYEKNGDFKTKKFFQVDIDSSDEWKLLGDGELKRQKMRLLGKITPENKVEDPYLDLRFTINDQNAKTAELQDIYLKLIDNLSLSEKFIKFTPGIHTRNDKWGNTFVQVRLGYDKKSLDRIINTENETYFELMAKFSKKSYQTKSWWKRRTNKNLSVSMREYKRKVRRFLALLKKARTAESDKIKYMLVVDAIDQILWLGDGSFNVSFLKRINHLLGKHAYFMDALITMPESTEMIYPAGTPLYNAMNPDLKKNIDIYEFEFDKPEEVWSVFY
jgi:hypothetical protein